MIKTDSTGVIICNSIRWVGTGGGLADEYWYEDEHFFEKEAPNKTSNGDLYTTKWKEWLGHTGIFSVIGVYRYSNNSMTLHIIGLNHIFRVVCKIVLINFVQYVLKN